MVTPIKLILGALLVVILSCVVERSESNKISKKTELI